MKGDAATKVAVLHTSFVFVTTEPVIRDLFRELLPETPVIDFVDGDVLAQVRRDEGVTPASVERMCHLALAAEAAGADIIFSACSSLGPAIDVARSRVRIPIVKIDDAMAAVVASTADRVGVLATVPTTLGPTAALVREHASRLGRHVEVSERLCEGAFDLLIAGDRAAHDAAVKDGAANLAQTCDVIVLAQASMARLAPTLEAAVGVKVLASPRSGVEDLRERLRAIETRQGHEVLAATR